VDGAQAAISEAQKAENASHSESHGALGWLADNVLKPAVAGSGVIQVANTFGANIEVPQAPAAKIGSVEWGVQTLASAGGAIGPYVLAGKAMGKALGYVGNDLLEARGAAARYVFANETASQILGAGAYEALKKPNEGETRLGNAIGTMAAFGVFEFGNAYANNVGRSFDSRAAQIAARNATRVTTGALGGLTAYTVSNYTSGLLGEQTNLSWDGAVSAMAGGAFMNTALPAVEHGITRGIDFAYNSRSYGPGVPVARYLHMHDMRSPELRALAEDNPLARVKTSADGVTRVDLEKNRIELARGADEATIGHEMTHLFVEARLRNAYRAIAELVDSQPDLAEYRFYQLRARSEASARNVENHIRGNKPFELANTDTIGEEIAANGRRYSENWKDEWEDFRRNAYARPRFDYAGKGQPGGEGLPLGAVATDNGVNFSVISNHAQKIEVLIFPDADPKSKPTQVVEMSPVESAQSGRPYKVWLTFVEGLQPGAFYLYRVYGDYNPAEGHRFNPNNPIIDPYSKAVTGDSQGPRAFDTSDPSDPNRQFRASTTDATDQMPRSVVVKSNFDWQGDQHPAIPLEDTIIYEVNLRGFTARDTSQPEHLRGTYRGFVNRLQYLQELGISAVELLPIMHWDAVDPQFKNPLTGEPLRNDWAYNTAAFQAPEGRLAADGSHGQQVDEFKYMVRETHKAGMEVFLDIVFNHSGEGDEHGPTFSFKGLDNKTYYMLKAGDPSLYENHSGTGNTMNVNDPAVRKLILDTLRWWVKEYHVDGFRFDLASVFNYDVDGVDKPKPPIIDEIENDPVLSQIKIYTKPRAATTASIEATDAAARTAGAPTERTNTSTATAVTETQYMSNGSTDTNVTLANTPVTTDAGQAQETSSTKAVGWAVTGPESTPPIISTESSSRVSVQFPLIKLIAEPWSVSNYKLGHFANTRWSEWNGAFRDTVRRFIKGDAGQVGALGDRVAGSPGWFNRVLGRFSINFVTAHDGFTLYDLVSYNDKHNFENGEGGRDGSNDNYSWNHGVEGPTATAEGLSAEERVRIESLRTRQMKNFFNMLFNSEGVPMMLYGDEIRRTQNGNNNSWPQARLNEIDWDSVERNRDMLRFVQKAIELRKRYQIGHMTPEDIVWHGTEPGKPDWSDGTRFIAWEYKPRTADGRHVYQAFNSYWEPIEVRLPPGFRWRRLVDTNLPTGQDTVAPDQAPIMGDRYVIQPRSSIVLEGEKTD
jgi:pullulanase/glycogen debranching enzyme